MSDAAIANIVTGVVTVATIVSGFLTLWAKLKYGVHKVEETSAKVDVNTQLTEKINKQTNGGLDDRFADHAERITALEMKVAAVDAKQDALSKNLDSTRHEIRGHLYTITNNLTLLTAQRAQAPVVEQPKAAK